MCKQMVLVCKLNKVDFSIADKELDKYISGLKEISYKEKHNGATEIATYANEERTKIFEINTRWYKDTDKYDLSIYELVESREIKVTKVNGDYFFAKINGNEKDIINHYNDSNFLSSDLSEQVKEIEFNTNDNLLPGEKERKVIYNFVYDNKAECYLY